MALSDSLKHIKNEISYPTKGYRDGFTMVRTEALSDLLRNFERLDMEARERHKAEHPEQYDPNDKRPKIKF